MADKSSEPPLYDVCLSFAGEDRAYVQEVAEELRSLGVRVFFDEYEEVDLWGKDLYVHLDDVYKNSARYCVMFVSKYYAAKLWTTHERKSAQERAFRENSEYILPARFDATSVPGLRDTVGYIGLKNRKPKAFASLIAQKVGVSKRTHFLPPIPDVLFGELKARSKKRRVEVHDCTLDILYKMKRMSEEERVLLYCFFANGCPAELPENVHINIDLLRRYSGHSPSKIKRMIGGLQSLGLFAWLREDDETEGHLGRYEMLVLEWHNMGLDSAGNVTDIAHAMICGATRNYCEEHGLDAIRRLDFSQLATVTTVEDHHEER